jgi:hypothetical protein
MTTETKLLANYTQAKQLVKDIIQAGNDANKTGETQYVRTTLEQFSCDGPWRLVLGIHPATKEDK